MLRKTSLNVLQVERKGYENSKGHDPSGQGDSFLLQLIEELSASQDSISLNSIRRDLLWIFVKHFFMLS